MVTTQHKGENMLEYNKIVSVEIAIKNSIRDGDTIVTEGFVGNGFPEYIAVTMENIFLNENTLKDLTFVYAAGQGDGKHRGMNHFAHKGMVKRIIGGHTGLAPKLGKMAIDNEIEAYNFPQGCVAHLFRSIASKSPGIFTKTGLKTFVDPRIEGGKVNEKTKEDLVELVEFDGEEYLRFKPFPINAAIIRGTTADTKGNITMEKECLFIDSRSAAMAAKASGGKVIVQVERIAESGSLNAKDVVIPGILVDYIVVCPIDHPEWHMQTYQTQYNPCYSTEIKIPSLSIPTMSLCANKVIGRRGVIELSQNAVGNLGIGVPEAVPKVAAEENILDWITFTVEPGPIGGIPAGELDFGATLNMEALIHQPEMFDFYDGGGLDITYLGLAQIDRKGNNNVSRFGSTWPGCGGFINISQNAKKVIFMGAFTAGGLKTNIENGKLIIEQEGSIKKFINEVQQITFSGDLANQTNSYVLYITERAVFKLTQEGLQLIEIAPGIDLEKHILNQMEFEPIMNGTIELMDDRFFRPEPVGLRKIIKTRGKYNE